MHLTPNRIEAVRRATIANHAVVIYEGDGRVQWPWAAYPIPLLYTMHPESGIALAVKTGLTSYLPWQVRVRLALQSLPVVGRWFS